MSRMLKCPICENLIETEHLKVAERLTCPHCSGQLALKKHKKNFVLACPVCKEEIFDPMNCENCDRLRDKKRMLEEGRL